jgi:hypothetical protein
MKKRTFFVPCFVLLAIQLSIAQDVIVVEPGKPCPMTGLRQDGSLPDQPHQQQNLMKNRYNFPKASDFNSSITLDAVLKPGDDRSRFSQGEAAQISGYVMEVKPGGAELCNCKTTNKQYYDTHIAIAASSNDLDETHWMIVEVTPRIRNIMLSTKGLDWTTDALKNTILHRNVTFQGWMMLDNDHIHEARNTHPNDPNHNNWRATCWEIHPVTSIEIEDQPIAAVVNNNIEAPENPIIATSTQPPSSTDMNTNTTPQQMLYLVVLCALLGMAGQAIRFVAGIRKSAQPNVKNIGDVIISKQMLVGLFISLAIGAIAGILAAVNNMGATQLDKSSIIAFIAAGYAGTDLIEGFVLNK